MREAVTINWSALDNRSVWGRALRLPLRLLPKGMLLPILKGPAKGLKWIVGSSNHGCWLGTYELDKQRVLERFVKPGMTVYDIGAQAGFYTLFFSRLVGGGTVYAFEPFAENIRYLLAHVTLNQLTNVKVVQVALGERSSLVGFTVDRNKHQNTIVSTCDCLLILPTVSVDEVIDQCKFSAPGLMKVDVEGAESVVLEGARRTLERYRPVVFIALHGSEQSEQAKTCWMLLEQLRYEVRTLDGARVAQGEDVDEVYAVPKEAL